MAQQFLDQFRPSANWILDTNTMSWIPQTAASAGGAVTIADGADVAEGSKADVAWTSGSGSVIALLKALTGAIALTASAPAAASVGLTSAQAVAANANRKGLTLTNLSAGNISFGIGAAAVLGSGVTLTPNGVWEMDKYTFSTAAINAIAAGAAAALAIQEYT